MSLPEVSWSQDRGYSSVTLAQVLTQQCLNPHVGRGKSSLGIISVGLFWDPAWAYFSNPSNDFKYLISKIKPHSV